MEEEQASKEMEDYFQKINEDIGLAYGVAGQARKKGHDPEDQPPVPLAKSMAERVEGLISTLAPQIVKKGIPERIKELEKEFGILDWRVSLKIAEEIAEEKFCKFGSKLEAIEVGIRVGFAYLTLGTVASPLEGFTKLSVGKRQDGKEYLAAYYSGPVRSAGGTAAAVSVVIIDYLRKKFGYSSYDPTDTETRRIVTELYDYHEQVSNLQYLPSPEEILFLAKNLPIQVTGEPSEKIEVSNYKDLPRIETNKIRSGVCLVMGEGVAQKAKKVWKQLSQWKDDFALGHWSFLEEFLKIQKQAKAKGQTTEAEKGKINPDFTFINDLVAGRPVLTHPMHGGGFRLRYGRARNSGYSSTCIHPATMRVLNNYIAVGTQLKMERPGKATALGSCDYLEGPIIKLKNGNVVLIDSEKEVLNYLKDIEEILFLGDILVNYGDFFNRAHTLVPPGYGEEWWIQELEKATVDTFGTLDFNKLSELTELPTEALELLAKDPIKQKLKASAAIKLSKELSMPLHPRYTYHWNLIDRKQFFSLLEWFEKARIEQEENTKKIILPYKSEQKRFLELIGLPHIVSANEFVVIEKEHAASAIFCLNLDDIPKAKNIFNENKESTPLELVNKISGIKIRDKSGIFIGARMGRPEKAKMRKLTGSPHVLFPVGEQGGKLRCFQSALETGHIEGEFPLHFCEKCNKETIFPICEVCSSKTKKLYFCKSCGNILAPECKHGIASTYKKQAIDIKHYFDSILKNLDIKSYPDLIKGVRGTSNKDHIPEHLMKGILRAKHSIHVNKDGTTRYDMTQLAITHFKPKEIGTDLEKLKMLGYEKDIHNKPLENENQVLEIKPQDVILPSCQDSFEEGADQILFRASKFVDDLLVGLYGLKPFYRLKTEQDLTGNLVVALAPHTSAGIIGRIIGFSKTQGFYAHPMLHAATRRDCFAYNSKIVVYHKPENKFSQIELGKFVESFSPSKKADNYGTLVKEIDGYYTYSLNEKTKKLELSKINEVSIHSPTKTTKLILEDERTLELTSNHKIFTRGLNKKRANQLEKGDQLVMPKLTIKEKHNKIEFDNQFAYPKIISVKHSKQITYCLNIEKNHNFICNDFLVKNCDGDEASVTLLMDVLLNFSRQFLPSTRGATQDAPLVLTSKIVPSEVDDMVFDLDIAWKYPLEFYEACLQYKQPWEVNIEQLGKKLNTPGQYEKMGFTHQTSDIASGIRCSAYKTLPSMEEKLKGQMDLAERIRAVETSDVARLVIEKHFIRDIKGNLRKFSMQQFRCVACNEKYRRPPLIGRCTKCSGKIIFTISQGSIVKYLEPAISLAEKYNLPSYLKQTLELTKRRIEGVFGKDKEKQAGLGKWF